MKTLIRDFTKISDPEKEGERYSMSRSIVLISITGYFLCLFAVIPLAIKGYSLETLEFILETLKWPIIAFAVYAFGGKALKTIKT